MTVPVIIGAGGVPARPTLPQPFPLLLDRHATVPNQRRDFLQFLVVGKPHEPIRITLGMRTEALFLLIEPFYARTPLDTIRAGLRIFVTATANGHRYRDSVELLAPVWHHECRITPQWLMRRAASRHLRQSKWFPTVADIIEHARAADADTIGQAERLWLIAESGPRG